MNKAQNRIINKFGGKGWVPVFPGDLNVSAFHILVEKDLAEARELSEGFVEIRVQA